MTSDVPWTHHRARVASLTRSRPADDPELTEARRDLKAARLADYIRKTVAAAPPLTEGQKDRLALLLRGPSHTSSLPYVESDTAKAERQAREARVAAQREAEALSRAIMACDVCDQPPAGHNQWDHQWQPGRAVKVVGKR